MKILIKRHSIDGQTWFEIMSNNKDQVVLVDQNAIDIFQKMGNEIHDIDAIRAEMVRNN